MPQRSHRLPRCRRAAPAQPRSPSAVPCIVACRTNPGVPYLDAFDAGGDAAPDPYGYAPGRLARTLRLTLGEGPRDVPGVVTWLDLFAN